MADLSDVEQALAAAAAGALYPNGTGQPSAVGAVCKIRRGWPNAAELDQDLVNGVVNVTVFSLKGHGKDTTRWQRQWVYGSMSTPTMSVAVDATQTMVTIGGAGGVVQNVGIETSTGCYAVRAQMTDTPATVAVALAALVPGASASGAVVTVPYDPHLVARTGGVGTASLETRRQHQGFAITVWAPSQPLRDAVASVVDGALAPLTFLTFPDSTAGRLTYLNTVEEDTPSKDRLWRRDLQYQVEYATLTTQSAAQMLFGIENIVSAGVTSTYYS